MKPKFECKTDKLSSEILCDHCIHGNECVADENPCNAYTALENDMLGGE